MRSECESSRWRVYRLKVLTSNERVDWWYWLCGTQHFASHRILWVLIIRFVLNSCTIYHDALISCGSSNHSQTQFEVPNMRTDFPNRLWWPFRPTDYWFCDELQSYLLASIRPERVTYYILMSLILKSLSSSLSILNWFCILNCRVFLFCIFCNWRHYLYHSHTPKSFPYDRLRYLWESEHDS